MKCFQLTILVLCVSVALAVGPGGGTCPRCAICTRYGERAEVDRVHVCTKYGVNYYSVKCGFWNWARCAKSSRRCSAYVQKYIRKTKMICVNTIHRPGCICP